MLYDLSRIVGLHSLDLRPSLVSINCCRPSIVKDTRLISVRIKLAMGGFMDAFSDQDMRGQLFSSAIDYFARNNFVKSIPYYTSIAE